MRTHALAALLLGLAFPMAGPSVSVAAPLPAGRILVADVALDAVIEIDPDSGDRTTLSSPTQGAGQIFKVPHDLVVTPERQILVPDSQLDSLVGVDPVTGDRTILSSADLVAQCTAAGMPFACCTGAGSGDGTPPCVETGTGPAFANPQRLALDGDGQYLITDQSLAAVIRVNRATGDRAYVSGQGVGAGDAFVGPLGLAVEEDDSILVADNLVRAVFRVDPVTGDRTLLSGPGVGTGPALDVPIGLTLDANGSILISDIGLDAVVRVNPGNGNRTIVSDAATGSGLGFVLPVGLRLDAEGRILVVDQGVDAVLSVDPQSGDRIVLAGCADAGCTTTVGSGPALPASYGPAVVGPSLAVPALTSGARVVCVLLLLLASAALTRSRRLA